MIHLLRHSPTNDGIYWSKYFTKPTILCVKPIIAYFCEDYLNGKLIMIGKVDLLNKKIHFMYEDYLGELEEGTVEYITINN